jgi:integrase
VSRKSGARAVARLTSTRVAALRPGRRQRDIADPERRGLTLRMETNGTKAWLFRYKWRGQSIRLSLGRFPTTSLADARESAGEYRKALERGIDPRAAAPIRRAKPAAGGTAGSPHSVEFLAEEFMARHVRPHRKNPEYVQRILDKDVLPEWTGRDARTITPREVVELLDKVVARGRRVMANRVAAVLSQLFRYGIHRAIVETSPVQLLMRPGGKEKPRERALSTHELKAILKDPGGAFRFDRMQHVALILLLTGQRRGELALARWSDIDLKAGTWRIPDENAKTGKGHVVPLSEWAVQEFKALQKAAKSSPFVLPGKDGKTIESKLLTRSLARCQARCKELKVDKFTLHDLRRTCRTGLAALRIAPHIAERVLNHAQERIPGTYDVHDYLEEKRDALDKWGAHLRGLIE